MRRFGRFIILAVLGFAIGGGVAWFQGVQEAKHNAASQQETVVAEEAKVVPVVEAPVAETTDTSADVALSEASADVAPVPVLEEQNVVEEKPATEGAVAEGAEQAVVAGSSVGGAFSLTDHNGVAVTEKSWPGKYKLVFFGFTHCPDICPTTLDKLTTALGSLGADTEKVQTLFVTTDPARDTAEVMKAYTSGYHASIIGLTGSEEQIKAAEDTYKVYAAKVPGADEGNYMMDHSAYVFLMSPDDQLLEIFKKDDTADVIVEKAKARMVTP